MPRETESFRSAVVALWFRLIGVATLAWLFIEAIKLTSGQAQGWSYYLTGFEVAFEVIVRLVAVALAGMALGTLGTALLTPFLWYFATSRDRLIDGVTKIAVGGVLLWDSFYALRTIVATYRLWGRTSTLLYALYFAAAAVMLLVPRRRKELVTTLDGFLGEKATRRTALATGLGAVALTAAEFAIGKTLTPATEKTVVARRPKQNMLLITFDALGAENMPLYGYGLPITPNIDAFARQGTVFTNFYSASTFTTPSVATILTGLYPSESRLYHLESRIPPARTEKSLPHLMRAAGYSTGASVSNPWAYYLAESLKSEYDSLPEPVYGSEKMRLLWDAARPLHQRSPLGSRVQEYWEFDGAWEYLPGLLEKWSPRRFARLRSPLPASASFEQAREVLAKLSDGFFLWAHVLAPHLPYLSDAVDRGHFGSSAKMQTETQQNYYRFWPHYTPDQQKDVDEARLHYDEFMLSSDRAFGSFMSDLERGGKLRDTTVIVSADHGESFVGGLYGHDRQDQTRPEIHIPLIIRTPGQQEGRRVAFTADQTALAPTILDLAGQTKPDWMPGRSLTGWLNRDGDGAGEGLAFTQYLPTNSIFASQLRDGTVGVIDGRYQYLLDLSNGKGSLRPLNEAENWNLDRSAEIPMVAERLRAEIYSRFPDLPRQTA